MPRSVSPISHALCSVCELDLDGGLFSKNQLKKALRRCKGCVEAVGDHGQEAAATPMPAASAPVPAAGSTTPEKLSGKCIEIHPAPFRAARDTIVLSVAPEPLPVTGGGRVEEQEKRILIKSRGWRQPHGLKGYSLAADYPDLYGYFDAGDRTSPRNEVAESIFAAYPCDGPGGRLPRGGIRGPVLVLRLEPPRATTSLGRSQHQAQFDELIAFGELRDTIEMYELQSAHELAQQRDMTRTIGSAGPGVPGGLRRLPPEMLAMLQATMMGGNGGGPHVHGPDGRSSLRLWCVKA